MKIGIIKKDIPFPKPEGYFQRLSWWNEAKRILKTYPDYEYLKEDPDTKTLEEYYENVTRAYLTDCILKDHKELKDTTNKLKQAIENYLETIKSIIKEIIQSSFNSTMTSFERKIIRGFYV